MKPDKREKRDKALCPNRLSTLLPWAALAIVLALSIFVVVPAVTERWTDLGVRVGPDAAWTMRTAAWFNGESAASPWRADLRSVRRMATAGATGACVLAAIVLPVLASRSFKARRALMLVGWLLAAAAVAWMGLIIVPVEIAMMRA